MMKTKYAIGFALILSAVLATSCSPSKYCAKPELNIPGSFASSEKDSTTIADLAWWQIYSDTLLQNLINKTLERNKDMLIASERVEEMRQLHRMDKADFWPSLSADLLADNEMDNYGGNSKNNSEEYHAILKLSWEIDLWGKLRWEEKKGAADYLSSIEAKRAMQMTLIAEVATSYFELVALDNQLQIVLQTVETRKEGVKQAKLRFEGGLTSETSYQQAQVELATAAARIPELKRLIAAKESQLSLLAGDYPGSVARKGSNASVITDAGIPIGIPSQLLQRRPDLRKAEAGLRAAEAGVGIAHTDRFPKLTINLSGGLENDEFKDFLRSPWSYTAGNLVSPIFSFGKRKAKFKSAVSAYNQEKLAYEKAVLVAFKEVHDAVSAYHTARENTILMKNLKDATGKYVELAQLQYFNGVIRYIDVLDAHRKDFTAQIDLNNAICRESLAFVTLYKALGGGW